jgi:hypothetical protein
MSSGSSYGESGAASAGHSPTARRGSPHGWPPTHWLEDDEPWDVEDELIARYDLPLNLDKNKHNLFHPELTAARAAAKARATELAILPW